MLTGTKQHEHRVSTLEQNIQIHTGLINRIDDAFRRAYVVREGFVPTPPNGPPFSAAPPSNDSTGFAVQIPQSGPFQAECQMPPSPTSPAPFHPHHLPMTAMNTQLQQLRANSAVDGSQLQQYPYGMQFNQGPVLSGPPRTSPDSQQPRFYRRVNRSAAPGGLINIHH